MLLDSNIVIYAVQLQFAHLREWCMKQELTVSDITRLEVLVYHRLNEKDKFDLHRLFAKTDIFPISSDLVDLAISLRQQRKMSIGDALIAATALEFGQILVTRNVEDFVWVEDLDFLNPFDEL